MFFFFDVLKHSDLLLTKTDVFCKNFKNTFFTEHLPMTAFVVYNDKKLSLKELLGIDKNIPIYRRNLKLLATGML